MDRPSRILLIIFPSQIRGGAEEYALTIASAAKQRLQWDVHAAFPKSEEATTLIRDFQKHGVSYSPLDIGEFSEYRQETWGRHAQRFIKTLRVLRSIRPERVLISLPWTPQGLGSIVACAVLNVPTVVVFQLVPYTFLFGRRRLTIYNWAWRRSTKCVGVSRYSCRVLSKTFQISEQEIRCIYNGASSTVPRDATLHNRSNARKQVREEFGLAANAKLAITVGRLHHQKGHDTIIPAIPHLLKEFPDLVFVWVGEGPKRQTLQQKLYEYGIADKVVFTGYRQDVPRLLTAADIFLFSTRFEGFPFSLLEAMAHNVPVVSSDSTSIPEVIEHRTHGLLFRTEDSCDLLEALRWALQHPEAMKAMAHKAAKKVKDFSQKSMLDQTLSLLQQ